MAYDRIANQIMGHLLACRITPTFPIHHICIDFDGLIMIKCGYTRACCGCGHKREEEEEKRIKRKRSYEQRVHS